MNKIDLIDRNSGLEYNISSIENFCKDILDELGISDWEFSLMFSDDEYIAELNSEYRHKEGPTDVLTFCEVDSGKDWLPAENKSLYYAGDIVISVDTLKLNAKDFRVDTDEELKRLIIHGILHLYGMNHETNNSNEKMLLLQEKILSNFGEYKF